MFKIEIKVDDGRELKRNASLTKSNEGGIDMLRIENLTENKVLTITANGRITKEDYEQLLPELEELLNKHDSLRFYIELEDLSGFEIGALWKDMKFDFKHRNQYGKTAIVGDKKWEEWATKISRMFFDSEIKFFYEDQSDDAWNWVNI